MSEIGRYPRLFPEPEQTIAGIGRVLRQGRTSCVEILKGCLARVDEWEPRVHAWVVLDRDGALDQARGLDDELRNGKDRGPLHGIPIGVKDIIDVAGLPTACGSKRWATRIADTDAKVVASLREAGALIMGKTVTTSYAWIDPPITRNPWNLERTPGGSSSGSAAAVASGMCFGALGTQTGGSITRPASFCGIAGMKPTRIHAARDGVFPFASSIDSLGPIARTVDDLRLLLTAIIGTNMRKSLNETSRLDGAPRLGRLTGFFERRAEPAMKLAFDAAVDALAARGAEIVTLEDPIDFEQVLIQHRIVMAAEAARVHSDWLAEAPDDYPPRIRELIEEGRSLSAQQYLRAKDGMEQTRRFLCSVIEREKCRALITPATAGVAPPPSTTGDPAFNSPWSYADMPTVSLPIGLSNDGMPAAIQLVGYQQNDIDLLRTSLWCEQAIRTWRQ